MTKLRCLTIFLSLTLSLLLAPAAAADWQPLYNRVDNDLQAAVDKRIKANPEWARLVRNKKMAIGVVDLSSEPPRFARVNGNQMMYAASLPKIAILVSAYVSFENGTLEETDEIHEHLAAMIRVSSNSSATHVIDKIGMKNIQAIMEDPKYGLYDRKRGGGLWVGKRFAKEGTRIGDPLHNISHGATATQVCRVFYLMVTGRLINPERSAQMLEDLADPGLHHKFVSQIEQRAPDARLYRKSGTWKQWHADAILVRGTHWRDYILVGMVESDNGENILRQLLPTIEELIVPPAHAESLKKLQASN